MIYLANVRSKADKKKKKTTSELLRLQRKKMQWKIDVTRRAQLRRMKLRWKSQWEQDETRAQKAAIREAKQAAKKQQLEVQKQINAEKLKSMANELDKTKFFDFVYRIGGEKARKQKTCGFPLTFSKPKI